MRAATIQAIGSVAVVVERLMRPIIHCAVATVLADSSTGEGVIFHFVIYSLLQDNAEIKKRARSYLLGSR